MSIERVATFLKLSKGVVYHYFPNKEEIALQLVIRFLRERNKRLESLCCKNCSSRKRILFACSADLAFHHEHLRYFPLSKYIMLKQFQNRTQLKTRELARTLFNKSNSFYSGLVRYGVSHGDFALPEQSMCEDVAFIVESMIFGVVDSIRYTNSIESSTGILTVHVNCLLDGLGWRH